MRELSDLFPILWVGLIAIGVVSSLVKSAKRQAAKARGELPPGPVPPIQTTGVPQGLHAQFAANAAAVAPMAPLQVRPPLPPPVRRAAVPPPPPQPAAPPTVPDYAPPATSYTPAPLDSTPPPHVIGVQSRPLRAARLFGTQHAILRSIIASEVLGKPRALRDEY